MTGASTGRRTRRRLRWRINPEARRRRPHRRCESVCGVGEPGAIIDVDRREC
jgi:hypothetical protein